MTLENRPSSCVCPTNMLAGHNPTRSSDRFGTGHYRLYNFDGPRQNIFEVYDIDDVDHLHELSKAVYVVAGLWQDDAMDEGAARAFVREAFEMLDCSELCEAFFAHVAGYYQSGGCRQGSTEFLSFCGYTGVCWAEASKYASLTRTNEYWGLCTFLEDRRFHEHLTKLS